ncbi:MAG: hypothetical protein ACK5KU_08330 [Beutenbergiaceae bacterium]
MSGLTLSRIVRPLFDPRQLELAQTRLERALARRNPAMPELGVFPGGSGLAQIGGIPAVQPNNLSCASTGLLLLNAGYDLALDTWLEQGVVPTPLPPELAGLSPVVLSTSEPKQRLAAAVNEVHWQATRRGLGPFPWPRRLGTPPWTVARQARVPGVVYRHQPVDDTNAAGMDRLLEVLRLAAAAGVPVPLYTGGDLDGGITRAVPRHMVLALPHSHRDRLRIYEPGSGRVETMAVEGLRARTRPHRALGGWTHLVWALLPIVR